MSQCPGCGNDIQLSGECVERLKAQFGRQPLEHVHFDCLEKREDKQMIRKEKEGKADDKQVSIPRR